MATRDADVVWRIFGLKVVRPFAGFTGLFTASALWVPYVLAGVTIASYLFFAAGHPMHDGAIAVGLVVALGLWLIAASTFGSAALPQAAHAEAYDRIETRLRELRAWVGLLSRNDPTAQKALESANDQLADVDTALRSQGRIDTRWVMATGYISLWRKLHHTEVEMFHYAPDDFVIRESSRDLLRLDGSEIPQRLALLSRLKAALMTVSPTAVANLDGGQPVAGAQPHGADTPQGQAARAVLGEIHRSVSEYRDDLRSGIVRHRNNSAGATVFFGFVAYALLALALSRGVTATALGAALAFFLTGAVIGLFGRLWSDTGNQSVEDDYGLSVVRLVQTPLFSGLAAVAAVVVLPLLYATSLDEALKLDNPSLDLQKIFDLVNFPFGLFFALVFGLSPGILLDRLHQASDDYKKELHASGAAAGK